MALSKVDYNSLDVTAVASKAVGWDSDPDALATSTLGGAWTLLSTQTASSSATLSFTSGLDSTYDAYCFRFYNMHPATDSAHFSFNASADSGSNYNVTKTTTAFYAYNQEDDGDAALSYLTGLDLAQSTAIQKISGTIGNANDEAASGYLYLFKPSSTTFVKHFLSRSQTHGSNDSNADMYWSGYLNTTSAVDAIQFSMHSGNIDAGVIKLYGIS